MLPRLLFVSLTESSFVREDLRLLEDAFDVRSFVFGVHRGLAFLRRLAEQAAWLRRETARADVVFGWFADYHLVLPLLAARRRGLRTAVVLGGFDCSALPELGYGVFASRWRAPLARFVLRRASLLLPVTDALIASTNAYTRAPERQTYGARTHVPGLRTPHRAVPTGYDPDAWPPGPPDRPRGVLTVAFLRDARTVRVKGVDVLFRAAERLPDVPFEVVGVDPAFEAALRDAFRPPPNVALRPPVPRPDLAAAYGRASVYAQLSRTEGLPNVLLEAMLCGCVPVGSPVFGIPEAIGGTGEIVASPEPADVARALRAALDAGPERRAAARERVVTRYALERRRAELHALLGALAGPGAPTGRR